MVCDVCTLITQVPYAHEVYVRNYSKEHSLMEMINHSTLIWTTLMRGNHDFHCSAADHFGKCDGG